MKKILLILVMLISINFCVSANEVKWFDIDGNCSVNFTFAEEIILANRAEDFLFEDKALYTATGKQLTGFNYNFLIPIAPGLYQGYATIFPDNAYKPVTQIINSDGKIIHSALWFESDDIRDQKYSYFINTKSPRILSDKIEYDTVTLLGPFTLYEEDNSSRTALSDYEGNLLTDYEYHMINEFKSDNPGKIYMHSKDNVLIADAVTGKYFTVNGYINNETGWIGSILQPNGKYQLVNLVSMEIIEKDIDEIHGAVEESVAFIKNGINYAYGLDGTLNYKGDNRYVVDYKYGKYVVHDQTGKLGIADGKFSMLYPYEYDNICILADGVYIFEKNGRYSLVSNEKTLYSDCELINKKYGYINVYRDIHTGIYKEDFPGESSEIIEYRHDIIDFEGNVIASRNDSNLYYITKYAVIVEDMLQKKVGMLISKNPHIEINGKLLVSDTMARIKNNITLVPLRALAEKTGFDVSYNEETKEIKISKEDKEIKFTLGEKKCYSNGVEISLDAAPQVINNRTLVPVRAISDAFGYDISWDEERRLVEIKSAPK